MSKLKCLTTIHDICLFVNDFSEAEEFYTKKFGFKVLKRQPDPNLPKYLVFDFHGTAIALWDKAGVLKVLSEEDLGNAGNSFMIAIRVPTVEVVDELHAELTERGVRCIKTPKTYPFKCRSAYYSDPENNIWEIFSYLEGAEELEII